MSTVPDHRYSPAAGGWLLLCRDGLVLGVEPVAGEKRLAALWPLVRDGAPAAALLDEMTRGGISAAPGFALLETTSASWRVLVRGDIVVEVAGGETVDGRGATAWVERELPGTPTLRVRPSSSSGAQPERPVRVGVVVADGWDVGPASAETVEPSPVAAHPEPVAGHTEPVAAHPEPVVPKPVAVVPPAASPVAEAEPVVEEEPELDEAVAEHTLVAQTITVAQITEVGSADAPVEPSAPAGDAGYDHLFGMTVVRKVEDAAVREPDEVPTGDLEDRTKVATGLAERRALRRAAKAAAAAEEAAAGPTHWLELSTGGREELDGTVIVGRAPSATRVSAGNIPRLVTMNTPNQDISRTHAQIAFDGGTVVVTDLHSSNGTFVVVPGRSPQKLRAGEPTPVVVDTVIDLGDGATLTVRVDS